MSGAVSPPGPVPTGGSAPGAPGAGLPAGLRPLGGGDPRMVGPYRLVGRIGSGGMGVVYAALDDADACVAVKVVHRLYATDPEFRARFAREVALVRTVRAACVPAFVGADTDAEVPWLATAYVPGPTLGTHVKTRGPLGERVLVAFAAGVAEALAAIHTAGVVHRDLKPGNVILAPDGPKVLDFGIARAAEETAITRTGAVVGTAGWVSPEQYQGRAASDRSDVFAWGCVVAYAATGGNPHGSGDSDVLAARIITDPPDLSGVPESLRPVLAAALAKEPAERPSAAELLATTTALLGRGEETSAGTSADTEVTRVLATTWGGLPAPEHTPEEWRRHAAPPRPWWVRRRRALTVGAGALVVSLLVGAASWAVTRDHGGGEPGTEVAGEDGGESGEEETDGFPPGVPQPPAVEARVMENGSVRTETREGSLPQVVSTIHPPQSMRGGADPIDLIRVTFTDVAASAEGTEFTATAEYLPEFGTWGLRYEEFLVATELYWDEAYLETTSPTGEGMIAELSPVDPTTTFTLNFADLPDTGVIYYHPESGDPVGWSHPTGHCYSLETEFADFPDTPRFGHHDPDRYEESCILVS